MFFRRSKKNKIHTAPPSKTLEDKKKKETQKNIDPTVQEINQVLKNDLDFVQRDLKFIGKHQAVIMYLSTLVNKDTINKDIIKPLMNFEPNKEDVIKDSPNILLNQVIYNAEGQTVTQIDQIIDGILRGKAVLLIDGMKEALLFAVEEVDKRSVDQPDGEQVIRGPRDGFIEHLQTNISLLRSRLPTPDLRLENMEIGEMTKSKVVVGYIDGTTNQELVDEVKRRLQQIDTDKILDTGYIEQYIQDNPRSPFPQIVFTERPDRAVGNLVEGRVVIMMDGSPLALVCPATLNQFYHTPEDYNERALMSSFVRIIRFLALNFSLYFPSLYVAILAFHPELIPAQFAVAVTSGRSGVPFPVFLEVLLMEIAMEVLREATVRMPQQVGGAISIVGVLVIGQAAVEAGFVSPITVVIIALSTIGSFATPAYNAAVAFRLLRFPLIILAGSLGLLGLAVGAMFIINHMLSLRSFGVPYLSPVAPTDWQGFKDSIFRSPLKWLKKRPEELHTHNTKRLSEKNNIKKKNVLGPKENRGNEDG
ncbi:spore germination protein [Alkalibacillus aidingensis]|uniref:spore germination protein n=1 Tax=Alkalibacillus aidingensis TaxID=2747607 RepID=UPI001660E443|nr:spore germination protein [Alkalibacillus aidingensis]